MTMGWCLEFVAILRVSLDHFHNWKLYEFREERTAVLNVNENITPLKRYINIDAHLSYVTLLLFDVAKLAN